MLRCVELGLNKELLQELTMGDIYDMLTEKANDQEEWPIQGTAQDMKNFF